MDRMTIHRALAELKLIDARIEKQSNDLLPLGIMQEGKLVNGFYKQNEFESNATSKFQSINALIDRKVALKSAIVASNSVTQVKIGEKTMSVADAINYKTAIGQRKALLDILRQRLRNVKSELNKNNEIISQNVQRLLEATFGKENTKVSQSDMEAVRSPYLKANEFHLVDPLAVEKRIEEMEKEIDTFETDVDAILSETNAITFIEI